MTRRSVWRAIAISLLVMTPIPATFASASTGEPETRSFLLRVANAFNRNYAANRDALVYQRWDARSQAVISEASYVRRHSLCHSAPGAAVVEDATPVTGGHWTVHYEISGTQLTDYWHYVTGHWRFDLLRSNPSAVRLYRLSFAAYATQVGCTR